MSKTSRKETTTARTEGPRRYEVLKGLSYYDNKARGEVGDVVDDLPAESIAWLLEQGCIKPFDESEA